jgi:Nuclease A inhibitor-like protein
MLSSDKIVKLLQECSSELTWMSEADYPWEVFLWSKGMLKANQSEDLGEVEIPTEMTEPNAEAVSTDPELVSAPLISVLDAGSVEIVESMMDGEMVLAQLQLPQDTLWREAVEEEFWLPVAEDPAYEKLRTAIAEHLTNVKIFLLGEIEIGVHIIGRTPQNDFIELTTKIVET